MPRIQCAALMPDGRRCRYAAAPNGLFCASHTTFATDAPAGDETHGFSPTAMRHWLLGTLQAEIMALCAADLPPLDRANAIADLGELFLPALPSEDFAPPVTEIEMRPAEVERQLGRD
jgi:hypothetical protein